MSIDNVDSGTGTDPSSKIIQYNLTNLARVEEDLEIEDAAALRGAVIDVERGFAYFGVDRPSGGLKIALSMCVGC